MISDQEAAAALAALPETSFLRQYAYHGWLQVPSPYVFHLVCGLGMLASVQPSDLAVRGVFLATTYPNFWGLVVGPSARAAKTLAINVSQEILREAHPGAIGMDPASEEALMVSLSKQPVQLLFYPEYSQFLANTQGGGGGANYRAKLRDAMTGLFDGTSPGRIKASSKYNLRDPRLSLIGGCTPTHLQEMTTQIDWQGGFMSRKLIMHAEVEREGMYAPTPDEERRAWLVSRLREIATGHARVGPCDGFADDATRDLWRSWCDEVDRATKEADPRVAGCVSRHKLHAAKIAMLLAVDAVAAQAHTLSPGAEPAWTIDAATMHTAIAIGRLGMRSVRELVAGIHPDAESRERAAVLRAIPQEGWISKGQILCEAQMSLRRGVPHLDTLVAWRALDTTAMGAERFYRRCESPTFPTFASSPPPPPL